MIFLQLFIKFFIIGVFTIGGGYAMLPLIQKIVVTDNAWISASTFTDIVAISQMTPGPIGINSATYIGYTVIKEAGFSHFLCICGSFTATLALVLPSFLIMLTLCRIVSRFSESRVFHGLMNGLRPTTVGLIGAAAILLISKENFPDWKSWAIFAVAFIVMAFTRLSPILMLLIAGAAGFLLY